MAKYPSQYTGQNFDTSVNRALNQFPQQLAQIGSKLDDLESEVTYDVIGDLDKDKTSYDDAENYKAGFWRNGIFVSSDSYKTITVPVEPQKLLVVFAYIWGTQANIMTKVTEDGTYISAIEKSKGTLTTYLFSNGTDEIQYVDVSFDSREQHRITTAYTISSILNTVRNYPEFFKLLENNEFIAVGLDKDKRILFGVQKDGNFYFGAGVPKQVIDYVISQKEEILATISTKVDKEDGKGLIQTEVAESMSVVADAEYCSMELDADKRIMGGRKVNGNKFENMPFETPSITIKSIHDYEKRLCLELDAERKILSYRKKDGTKVEKAGLETPFIELSYEGKERLKEDLGVVIDDGDILTLHPKETVLPILKTFKGRPSWFLPYSENYKYVNFNMLWFSDLHHVDRRLARISKFYNEYKDYIDSVLCSGDALNSYGESFDFWHNNGADSFLNVIGNHECFGGERTVGNKTLAGWIPPGYSQKECYDKYFKDYLSETGITIEENKAYWYKDYVSPAKTNTGEIVEGVFAYKIRLIGIDYYHWKESRKYTDGTAMEQWPDGEPLDTGQQQLWLRNLLQDAYDNDYSVICVIHNPVLESNFQKENTPFQTLEPYLGSTDFSRTEILDEVQTFINNGGKFITWLTGHTHDDRFGVVKSHPDQLMITVGTAGNLIQSQGSRWEFPSFMDRTENTINDDLFNLVSVNTYAHSITLYRIGCPYDKHGRHLDSIAYDYVNKKIL